MTSSDDLIERLQDAVCNNIGPCCARWGAAFEQAECRKRVHEYGLSLGLQFTGDRFKPETAQRCLELSVSEAQSCLPTEEQIEAADNACWLAAGGYEAGEGPCSHDAQCAPSPRGPTECRVDVCSVVIKLPLGATCTPYDYEPAALIEECDNSRGEVCDSATGTCVARGPDAECAVDRVCGPGFYCGALTCEQQRLVGESCDGSYDEQCAAGTICDKVLGICRSESEVQPFTCNATGCCPADHFRQDGVCVPQVEPGGSCEVDPACRDDGLCACPDYRTCSSAQKCLPRTLSLFCAIN